jgi:chitinase
VTDTYLDAAVAPGGGYTYAVDARDDLGASAPGAPASITIPGLPAVPAGLTATAPASPLNQTECDLAWAAVAGASGYVVSQNGTQLGLVPTGTSAVVTGLTPATKYQFAVAAVNAVGQSGFSPAVAYTTAAGTVTKPLTPTGLAASLLIPGGCTLSWNPSTGATAYLITRVPSDVLYPAGSATTLAITGLKGGTHMFTVTASNSAGSSAPSAPLTVTIPGS